MRILAVTNFYPPHHYGGYELSCHDVMRHFRDRGHAVEVLTSTWRVAGIDTPKDEPQRGISRSLRIYWDDHVLIRPRLVRRIAIERHNQRVLGRTLEVFRPDVASIWNMGAVSMGILATLSARGIPMVLNVCNDWLVYGPELDPWHRLFRNRPTVGRVVRVLTGVPTSLPDLGQETACFVSEQVREEAENETPWHFERSTVVYSGIDEATFGSNRVTSGPDHWSWRLLFVGRLDRRKGLDTLLDAMRRLPPEASLEILGKGDPEYTRQLHDRIEILGLADRVRMDAVQRDQLAEHYRQADVVVFPSEWDEPFGLVPVEAMSCGTPVVATGTGGSGEFLIDQWNCVRYPAGDAGALDRVIRRLASEPETRERITKGGFVTAKELDTHRLADVLEAWHRATAERFSAGEPPHRPSIVDHVVD